MSEEDFDSSIASFSSETGSLEASYLSESKVDEGIVNGGVLKKIKHLKISVLILGVSLLVSLVVITVLIFLFFYLLYAGNASETEIRSEEPDMKEIYSYPFISTKDGEINFEGTVSTTSEISSSFKNVISDDESSTFLAYRADENLQMYEVNADVHCCGSGVQNEDVGGCRKEATGETWKFPAKSEEDARSIFESNELKKSSHLPLCKTGESSKHTIVSIEDVPLSFHCHARCEGSSLSHFEYHNAGIVQRTLDEGLEAWEKTDKSKPKPTYSDAETAIKVQVLDQFEFVCRHHGIAADSKQPLGIEDATEQFALAADNFCGNFAGVENLGTKIFHLCRADAYNIECRPGDCWDSEFHELYLSQGRKEVLSKLKAINE